MSRRLDRAAAPWIFTLVLLAFGLEAWAKAPPLTDAQRLKRLQQQLLMSEPAEKRSEFKERREQWRKAKWRKAGGKGQRARKPKAIRTDLTAAVRGAQAGTFDFMAPARTAAREAAAAPSNVLMNDTTGEPLGSCQSEISIASHGNNVVAAWNDGIGIYDSPESDVLGFAYSTDGGETWTDGGAPLVSTNGVWVSDPVVAVNEKTGTFYFCGLVDRPSNGTNSIDVARGGFSGNTFNWTASSPVVTVPNTLALLDKEWMAVDSLSGNLYVSYTYFTSVSDEIRIQRSVTDGQSWTIPITLSSPGDAGYVQGSRPAVGPDGEVYVVWHAIGPSASTLGVGPDFMRVRRSLDFGASYEPEVTAAFVFSNFGSGAPGFNRGIGLTFPGIAVDRSAGPNRGRVYLSWAEAVNFVNDYYPQPGVDPAVSETESNDGALLADAFSPGSILRGVIAQPTNLDYWSWNATQGQTYMFWVDSLAGQLDASLRVFCTNATNPSVTPTYLAFSQNGQGGEDFIAFTAPTTGTYFLRIASYLQGRTGGYRIRSAAHNNSIVSRARDQRDVFVVSSNNGIAWGTPVRVNDSPGWFDDWLPEVAVDGFGRVFVSAYDWRDAVSTCGGGSNAYLYRSVTGGSTWNAGTRISDQTTEWSDDYSDLIPNQGDYIGLYARDSAVFVTWADHRGNRGDPDSYFSRVGDICSGPPVIAQNPTIGTDNIVVTWTVASGTVAQLYRRAGNGAFVDLGQRTATAQDEIVYTDTDVTPGVTYTYRLGITGYCQAFGGEISALIPLPQAPELTLLNVWPNPAQDDLNVSFVLDGSTRPATVSLHDITGREVQAIEVTGQGPYVVSLTSGVQLPPGVYFVRLTQGDVTRSRRVSIFP
jgi:hypothetical protein